jgi:hypothetical protein
MKKRIASQLKTSGAVETTVGYALNGLGNALFIYLISIHVSSEVLLQTIVYWSAIFWSGTVLAPFETLFLYSKAKKTALNYSLLLPVVGVTIFSLSGIIIFLTLNSHPITIFVMAAIGYSNLINVRNRPTRLAMQEYKVVARANTYEGLARVFALLCLIFLKIDFNSSIVLTVFLLGSLSANVIYLRRGDINFESKDINENINKEKIIGLSIIGASSALFTGGLPYFVGIFNDSDLTPYVTFYTITRLFLIIQSVVISIRPNRVNNFGINLSLRSFVVYSIILLIPTSFGLFLLKKLLSKIGLDYLSAINNFEVMFFSSSLVFGALYSIYVSSKCATDSWKICILPSVSSACIAIISLTTIINKVIAFQATMVVAPLSAALLVLYRSAKISNRS